ncbi:MAG: AAA family ATPase [Synergistaceae bacterium]|nr:AAA family ATPase [Synergistaceae bacterium]
MNIINAKDIKHQHLTVLIYGTPGMGKTTLLGNLNGRTLIVDVDKGTSVLIGNKNNENVDVLRLEALREFSELVKQLRESCPYDNVCLDSISELERSILTRLASANNNGIPSQQDYGKINVSIMNICRQLREIHANIFFTAWEKYTEVVAPSGEKYSRIEPLIRDKNMDNIVGLCDITGRLYLDRESEERRVWLEARPNIIAKDRVYKRQSCACEEVIPCELSS